MELGVTIMSILPLLDRVSQERWNVSDYGAGLANTIWSVTLTPERKGILGFFCIVEAEEM